VTKCHKKQYDQQTGMHVICKQKQRFTKLSFIAKCTKNCVDMCASHGRGAIVICLSENGALAKKDWETLV